jgi:sulfur-oxidizing protein SoxZ
MAKSKIKQVKAKVKNGVVVAKVVVFHPMMTYNQAKKKTGNSADATFITHLTGKVAGKTVLDISTSQFFSKNPIFEFKFKADGFKDGDKLEITATDTREGKIGENYKKSGKIKGL